MPFCALPTRVGPISPSDHPGEPATPAALPPPSLVVEAVAAARASMVIRAVVAAGAPPLALAVQRGEAVTAAVVAEVEASAVSVAAPVETLLSFCLLYTSPSPRD